jgi:flavodoxin I
MTVVNVIYQSRGGNTKKVADAIAEVCGVEAVDIHDPHNITSSDLLFIGMGIYAGKPESSVLDYLDQLPVNTIKGAALFNTSATGSDHMELAVNLLEHKGIAVYPRHLLLRGRFLFLNKGKPGRKELRKARAFAQEVLGAFNY